MKIAKRQLRKIIKEELGANHYKQFNSAIEAAVDAFESNITPEALDAGHKAWDLDDAQRGGRGLSKLQAIIKVFGAKLRKRNLL